MANRGDIDSPLRDARAVALMMAASLTVMTAATISPALPGLERELVDDAFGSFLIRMLVPAPSLAVVLASPACGVVADRYGRRNLMLCGLVLFVIAGTIGAALASPLLLICSRLVLGIALAMIMTAQSALMADYFAGDQLHAVAGGQVSARNFGGFVFILLAGILASVNARLAFAVYALPVLAFPLFWRVIVDQPRRSEQHAAPTSLPSRISGNLRWLALGQLALTAMFFVMPTQLPFFMTYRGQSSPLRTGTALAVLMVAGGFAALLYPRFRTAVGNTGTWASGFALMACGFAAMVVDWPPAGVAIACGLIGSGYALAAPGFVALAQASSPPDRRGKTAALMTGSVFLGQFVSPFVSNPAIARFGWETSYLLTSTLFAVAAALCGFLGMRSRVT